MFWNDLRRTLTLAAPLILGQVATLGMGFVDTVMAGRYDAVALAAVAIGGAVWSAGFLFIIGVLMAIPPHISQLDGANRIEESGRFVHQAGYLAALLALLLAISLRSAGPLLRGVGVDPTIVPTALAYLDAISWGAPGICVYLVLRFFSEGLSITRATMYFGFLGLALNIPTNYVLIYGHLGLPALGAVGCGYATALVQWLQLLAIIAYLFHHSRYREAGFFTTPEPPKWSTIREILHVGLPIGGSVFIEGSLFVTVALLMGTLGTITAAAHQVAINFSAMAFMIPLGLSMAITVRVGNAIGRQDSEGARRAAISGFAIVLVTQITTASMMMLFPGLIAALYTEDTAVRGVVLELLFLAAIFQLPDGIQVAAAGALRGLKDTRWPMVFTIVAYWLIGLPLGYGLGITWGFGATGMWIGLIGGLSVAALLLGWRYARLSKAA